MPLNLIGLLKASRAGAAPGQGFKNYAAGSPTTGTAMTQYIVGQPFVTQNISGNTQTVGTLTPVSSTYVAGNPIPAFTNVTLVASFLAGTKAESIYDAVFVVADALNQVLITQILTDGLTLDPGFQYVTVRSVNVDWTAKTVTAVLTFNNSFGSSSGTWPPSIGPANAGYIYVRFRLSFVPEPFFNLRAYTGVPNDTGGFNEVVVRPYRNGQPTTTSFSGVFIPVPTSGTWVGDGSFLSATTGGLYYVAETPGNSQTNFYLAGYSFRPQLDGGWTSAWNTDYGSYSPEVRFRWYLQNSDGSWPATPSLEYIATSLSQVMDSLTFMATWTYPDGENPSVASITVRLTVQVISPYTSAIGTYERTITLNAKSFTLVGPGGGAVQ